MTPKLKYLAVTLALFLALSACFERQAHAYVDPGNSLLAFQTVSAMLTGGLFYFRRRLKSLLLKREKGSAGVVANDSVQLSR
jgi:hypothetical protein